MLKRGGLTEYVAGACMSELKLSEHNWITQGLGQGINRLKPRLNWQLMAKAGAVRARASVVKAQSRLKQDDYGSDQGAEAQVAEAG